MSPEWLEFINKEASKEYMIKLKEFISQERSTKLIYPDSTKTFNAFMWCPYKQLKVVILGQDPYHSTDTADGLAFSTQQTQRPTGLDIIFDEIWQTEMKQFHAAKYGRSDVFQTNDLRCWAVQGVLLLNTILTVEKGKVASHARKGWEQFTSNFLYWLNIKPEPIIFLLWGKEAQKYKPLITGTQHIILEAAHPNAHIFNAENGGFMGCNHFTQVNELIKKQRKADWFKEGRLMEINWATFPHNKISSHNEKKP